MAKSKAAKKLPTQPGGKRLYTQGWDPDPEASSSDPMDNGLRRPAVSPEFNGFPVAVTAWDDTPLEPQNWGEDQPDDHYTELRDDPQESPWTVAEAIVEAETWIRAEFPARRTPYPVAYEIRQVSIWDDVDDPRTILNYGEIRIPALVPTHKLAIKTNRKRKVTA